MTGINIRSAFRGDLACIRYVEQQAELMFPAGNLPASLPHSAGHLAYLDSILNGLCWVAENAAAEIIGFIACVRIGSYLHILEMDVLPSYGRQGVGQAMLAYACAVAATLTELYGLTLTTFRHLPWNQAFYQKHGFEPVPNVTNIPHIADFLHDEEQAGFSNRIGMLKRTKVPE